MLVDTKPQDAKHYITEDSNTLVNHLTTDGHAPSAIKDSVNDAIPLPAPFDYIE